MRQLRALGLARVSLAAGLAVTTVVFTVMAYEGHQDQVFGALAVELFLILVIQQGLTQPERWGFSAAAVSLALVAVIVGSAIAG